nr:MAG TPA: hypothetical protein [Caudoviricetes sp.]
MHNQWKRSSESNSDDQTKGKHHDNLTCRKHRRYRDSVHTNPDF